MKDLEKKRAYSAPEIEQVILDNEISLVLQSDPVINQGSENGGIGQDEEP